MALEEVKLLQKQRQRKLGIPAVTNGSGNSAVAGGGGGGEKKILNNKVRESVVLLAQAESGCDVDKDKDKDDLVLQDTFAQETAVMLEDPNMYDSFYLSLCYTCLYIIYLYLCYKAKNFVKHNITEHDK